MVKALVNAGKKIVKKATTKPETLSQQMSRVAKRLSKQQRTANDLSETRAFLEIKQAPQYQVDRVYAQEQASWGIANRTEDRYVKLLVQRDGRFAK